MTARLDFPIDSFLKIVQQEPHQLALIDSSGEMTYLTLHQKSNQLANYLVSLDIRSGDRIGLLTSRSIELVIGLLATLKLGAVYVPLDPDYPIERTLYMMDSSEIKLLLVTESARNVLNNLENRDSKIKKVVFLDDWIPIALAYTIQLELTQAIEWKLFSDQIIQNPVCIEDLLIILFTSGSTGQPKGVALPYKGYLNNFLNMQGFLKLNVGYRVAQTASACFDISITELLMPLLYGATVCIASHAIKKNPWALSEWIQDTRIQIIQFVPSLFHHFLIALADEPIRFNTIEKLLFIGEPLRANLIKIWFQQFSHNQCIAINLYGPVETSIEVSAFVITSSLTIESNYVPIGKPFENVSFLLFDDEMKEVDIGENGMLYIGGPQLAKGYLNSLETQKAFINYSSSKERIYCTGDIVCKLASDDYLFVARKDRQIKIRGYRVELGEIENIIAQHQKVKQVAVINIKDNEIEKIIAYISPKQTPLNEIKKHINKLLPTFMMPHEIIFLDQIPVSDNDKTDYNSLIAYTKNRSSKHL